MSDFLSNLAARSLGVAEVVRPRVASLFEPAGVAASWAGILDLPSVHKDVALNARPSAPLEFTHFFEPPSAPSSQPDRHEGGQIHAIAPATSDRAGRSTEGSWSAALQADSLTVERGIEARSPESTVAPATRALDPSRVSPPAMMRTGEAGAVRPSGQSSLATRPARVPDWADGDESSSRAATSESWRRVNERLGASGDLRPADESHRQAVSLATERDAEPRSPEATAAPVARFRDSVARPFETGALRQSVPDASTTRPARVRDVGDGGEAFLSTVRRDDARPANEALRGFLDSRSPDPSRGKPIAPPEPGTARPVRIVVEPRVALDAEQGGPGRPRPAVRAEPTIQVTIGRVEVRATHPAPPVIPRDRRTPTAMSLEEYLRRRADGSAR